MLKGILAVEEEHADELADLREDLHPKGTHGGIVVRAADEHGDWLARLASSLPAAARALTSCHAVRSRRITPRREDE